MMLTTYRSYKYLPLFLIGSYLAVVIIARVNNRFDPHFTEEIFPFFNWSLFSVTSNERTISVIRFDSINEKPLPSPRLYFDMGDIFASAKQRDPTVWKTTETLASAIQHDDQETISRARKLIEDRYMAELKSADYAIVRLTYDPIERLRYGAVKDSVVLAIYRKRAP